MRGKGKGWPEGCPATCLSCGSFSFWSHKQQPKSNPGQRKALNSEEHRLGQRGLPCFSFCRCVEYLLLLQQLRRSKRTYSKVP